MKIYHTGDTDEVPEITNVKDITAALVPIDGDGLTMSTEQATDFINNMSPAIVIPMHYEISKDKAKDFKQLVDADIDVRIMQD